MKGVDRSCGMATIAILIGTSAGARLMAASSERDAAIMVERVMLQMDRTALPVPLWVQCGDAAIAARLTDYLADLQDELIGVAAGEAP